MIIVGEYILEEFKTYLFEIFQNFLVAGGTVTGIVLSSTELLYHGHTVWTEVNSDVLLVVKASLEILGNIQSVYLNVHH